MEDRLFDQKQKCRSLWGLIPKYCDASPNTAQVLERLLEIYQEDIGPRASVVPEVQRWVNKWKKEDVSTRDGFRERGALGHLSFWVPMQV